MNFSNGGSFGNSNSSVADIDSNSLGNSSGDSHGDMKVTCLVQRLLIAGPESVFTRGM